MNDIFEENESVSHDTNRQYSITPEHYQEVGESNKEYISDSDEEEMCSHNFETQSDSSTSFSSEVELELEHSCDESLAFFNLCETLRKDIAELKKEGLLKEGGALYYMAKQIESMRNKVIWRKLARVKSSLEVNLSHYCESDTHEILLGEIEDISSEEEIKVIDYEDFLPDDQLRPLHHSTEEDVGTLLTDKRLEEIHTYKSQTSNINGNKRERASEEGQEPSHENHKKVNILTSQSEETAHGGIPRLGSEVIDQDAINIEDISQNITLEQKSSDVSLREDLNKGIDLEEDLTRLKINDRGSQRTYVSRNLLEEYSSELSANTPGLTETSKENETDLNMQTSKGGFLNTSNGNGEAENSHSKTISPTHLKTQADESDSQNETAENGALAAAYEEYLKETWYYDEIETGTEVCRERATADEKEVAVKYPLTEQQKMARSYEIRKEKAWQKWLTERNKLNRRKALLEIQCVMMAQKALKKTVRNSQSNQEKVQKKEKERLQARVRREKEIAQRLALEDICWQKKREDDECKRAAKAKATRRRLMIQPIPSVLFPQKNEPQKIMAGHCSSRDIQDVNQLPLSDKVIGPEKSKKLAVIRREKQRIKVRVSKTATHSNYSREKMVESNEEDARDENKMQHEEKENVNKIFGVDDRLCSKDVNFQGKFQVTPDVLVFKDFIPKQTYHQKITVHNLDMKTRQICIVGIWYYNDMLINEGVLEFDRSIETVPKVVRINPGLKYDIWLTFKPRSIADSMAVSAQVALWIGQGHLSTRRKTWAQQNRAHIPEKIKDAGFVLVNVLCRHAQVEPFIHSQKVILDVHPLQNGSFKVPYKDIIVENRGMLNGYFEIQKVFPEPPEVSKELRYPRAYHSDTATSVKHPKRSQSMPQRSDTSIQASLHVKRNITTREMPGKKVKNASITQDKNKLTKSSSADSIAKELMENVLEVATSCFELNPQYFSILPAQTSKNIRVKLNKSTLRSDKKHGLEEYILKFDDRSPSTQISVWIGFRYCEPVKTLTVNKECLNFGICSAGGKYQDFLEVNNSSGITKGLVLTLSDSTAKQVTSNSVTWPTKYPSYPHALEIYPKGLVFVQPYAKFLFAARLTVGEAEQIDKECQDTMDHLNFLNNVNDCLSFELELSAMVPEPNMSLSGINMTKQLIQKIHAEATLSDLAVDCKCLPLMLDPQFLSFGRCVTTETVRASIKIISQSKLTLSYGFLGLPKYVSIQPGYGFGQILPGEVLQLDLLYSPLPEHGSESPGKEFKFALSCYNISNRFKFNMSTAAKIMISAHVVHIPDFHLSCSTLFLPATPCGSFSVTSITISSTEGLDDLNVKNSKIHISSLTGNESRCTTNKNVVKDKSVVSPGYWYELIPQCEEVLLAPRHGYIKPGERRKVKLFFQPMLAKEKVIEKAKSLQEDDEQLLLEKQMEIEKLAQEMAEMEKKEKGKNKMTKEKEKKKKSAEKKSEAENKRSPEKKKDSNSKMKPNNDAMSVSKLSESNKTTKDHLLANGPQKKPSPMTLQAKTSTKETLPDSVKKLLFPAEKSLLESLKPYIFQTKIACVVVKGYPSDGGTGISKFSENLPNIKNKPTDWCEFMKPSMPSISRGCAWVVPPKEKISDVIWVDVICPVVRPSFLIRECGGEWTPKLVTSKVENEVNMNEITEYQGKPIWSNMKVTQKQVVDFEFVAIGGGAQTLDIKLQNISPTPIKIVAPSLLNPLGPFSCPCSHHVGNFDKFQTTSLKLHISESSDKNIRSKKKEFTKFMLVPPESMLRIPVTFTPETVGDMVEFMDIEGISVEGITTYVNVVLHGKGELAKYHTRPSPPNVTLKPSKNEKPSIITILNLGNSILDFYIGKKYAVAEDKSKKGKEKSKAKSQNGSHKTEDRGKSGTTEPERKASKKNKGIAKKTKKKKTEGSEKNEENDASTTVGENEKVHDVVEVGMKIVDSLKRNEENLENVDSIFMTKPQDFVRVMPQSEENLQVYLLPDVKDVRKTFGISLHLFGRGPSVIDVIVKVAGK